MATKRQVFYSFYYNLDYWRVANIRNIGAIERNKPAPDNDWEKIKKGGDEAIKKWIKEQMRYRSCTVVLVGNKTAGRKWINHEIVKSWDSGMGIFGIYIHGLKDDKGYITNKGGNPFDHITYGKTKKKLSAIVKCYNPAGINSKEKYNWLSKNLSNAIEEAIKIRNNN